MREEMRQLDEAAARGPMPVDSPNLLLLTVAHVDDLIAAATAKASVHRLSTPLDGALSGYRVYYRRFDRGSKMDVYEPAGIITVHEGHYTTVKRTELPEEVREALFWYSNNVIVKAVRLEDSHARSMNEQVMEGYTVARYCLSQNRSFMNTTFFRYFDAPNGPDRPSGISLIIQEPEYTGAPESSFRPLYIGQEGMAVVVQRRAHGPNIQNAMEMVRQAVEEAILGTQKQIAKENTLLRRLTTKGRRRIRQLREELRDLEHTMTREKQHVVGHIFKPFKDFMANTYGVADLDPDFERNYSLDLKQDVGSVSKGVADKVSHLTSFDYDQFRTLKSFIHPKGRLPDAFETESYPELSEGIRLAQIRALSLL